MAVKTPVNAEPGDGASIETAQKGQIVTFFATKRAVFKTKRSYDIMVAT